MENKVQLHSSDLRTIGMCAYLWQRTRGERFGVWDKTEQDPPGIPIAIGQANHFSASHLLTSKKDVKVIPTLEEIQDVNRDSFENQWLEGLLLAEDEALNVKKTHDQAIDLSINLAKLFYVDHSPAIEPTAIAKKFVIELENYPVDLAGEFDWEVPDGIEDLKTMSSNKKTVQSIQMGTYSLAYKIEHGKYPSVVRHRKLIKTKVPKSAVEEAVPDDTWVKPVLRRIENTVEQIEAIKSGKLGELPPADPDHWKCSRRYCSLAARGACKFWSGRE
jgi:hypothetical protein